MAENFVCHGGVPAVVTIVCGAVANEVFEGCNDAPFGVIVVALLTAYKCGSEVNGKFRCFTKAFVHAAPAFVLRNSDGWCKVQVNVCSPHFFGDGLPDFTDECGISRGAEPDVVRENRCVLYVGDAVDVVLAVGDWDFLFPRVGVKVCRVSAAALECGPADTVAAFYGRGFGLRHLCNHVVERHFCHDAVYAVFNRGAL